MAEPQTIEGAVRAVFKAGRERRAAEKASAAKGASDEKKPYAFKAISTDEAGVIVGIGAAADNIDLDDEVVVKSALIQMAFDFCSSSTRTFKANHQEEIDCALVQSWVGAPIFKSGLVLKKGQEIPADDPIIAINIEKGNETHWFVSVKPSDPAIVEEAKKGGIAGFSWAGAVVKTPVKG